MPTIKISHPACYGPTILNLKKKAHGQSNRREGTGEGGMTPIPIRRVLPINFWVFFCVRLACPTRPWGRQIIPMGRKRKEKGKSQSCLHRPIPLVRTVPGVCLFAWFPPPSYGMYVSPAGTGTPNIVFSGR